MMVPIKYPMSCGFTFATILIVSELFESTAAISCYFSEIMNTTGQSLCIMNAPSTVKTVSNAVQCVFNCEDANFINIIGIGSGETTIKCEMFDGIDPVVYAAKEGCRGFKV
jgi:hypothetical protein